MKSNSNLPPGFPGHWFLGNGQDYQRDPLGFYSKLKKKCGDSVTLKAPLGINWFLFFHPDDVETILHKEKDKFCKPGFFVRSMSYLLGKGLVTSESKLWKNQRQLLTPAFHKSRLVGMASLMTEETEKLCESLIRKSNGKVVDLANELQRLTLRIASLTLFGADIEKHEKEFGYALDIALKHLNFRFAFPIYPPPWIPLPENIRFRKQLKVMDKIVYSLIALRKNGELDKGNDILSALMKVKDPDTGRSMPDKQLRDEVITLLLAGHDTTSAAIAWTFFLLSKHPQILSNAIDEIDGNLKSASPRFENLQSLPYLTMIFKESLRLFPPAWGQPRQTLEDVELGKYIIPKGSPLVLSQYITHRHPDFWENPETFDPERFTQDKEVARHNFAYFPFGGGPRICIGYQFAMMEGPLIIATILQRIKLEMVANQEVIPDPTFTLKPKFGLKMNISKRV